MKVRHAEEVIDQSTLALPLQGEGWLEFTNPAGEVKGLVVFIHGYLDCPDAWQPVADAMTLPGWQKVAVALRPAAIASSSDETLTSYAAQVVETIARVRTSVDVPVVIVGHSMGGQIAELVATDLGNRLGGLALIVPAPLVGYPLTDTQMTAFRQRAAETNEEIAKAGKLARSKNLPVEGLNLLVQSTLATPASFAIQQLEAWTGGHSAGKQPSCVETAVTVIAAADDGVFTPDFLAEHVASRFTDNDLHVVRDSGHWPHLEQPVGVAAHLEDFIQRL
ncbi:alpha/beta hydrolase [Paraburkholderia sediminicola]|uniref:alpha/beta fold hydrolase n=1 Tax=Paraburkholderia sediminicola TaxID=458836 RepID=UPI0038B9F0F5